MWLPPLGENDRAAYGTGAIFRNRLGLTPAVAAPRPLDMQEVNAAEFKPTAKASHAANVKVQVLLDRAGFSPGAIDGRASDNFENALRAFQKKNALRRDRQARQGDMGPRSCRAPSLR